MYEYIPGAKVSDNIEPCDRPHSLWTAYPLQQYHIYEYRYYSASRLLSYTMSTGTTAPVDYWREQIDCRSESYSSCSSVCFLPFNAMNRSCYRLPGIPDGIHLAPPSPQHTLRSSSCPLFSCARFLGVVPATAGIPTCGISAQSGNSELENAQTSMSRPG